MPTYDATAATLLLADERGILLRDMSGALAYIDLVASNAGFAAARGQDPGETRGVAVRDACGSPPYIEFQCSPPVRLVFPRARSWRRLADPWGRRWYTQFRAWQQRIVALGWQSLDLS